MAGREDVIFLAWRHAEALKALYGCRSRSRGVGLTERTLGGYDKKTIAADMPR
jgi:hypothetical protein